MAEGGGDWEETTYLRKKTPRAAEAKSKKVNEARLCDHAMSTCDEFRL